MRATWMLAALSSIPLVGVAGDEPKLSCIKDFVFSQDFLARHPRAGEVCREVVMKDGQKWARFDARVVGLKDKQVTVNFINSIGDPVEELTFTAPADARVVVNGQEMTYSALGTGDPLSFWIPESRAGFYAEPGSTRLTEIKVARIER